MNRKYYSMVQENNIATINIYGDITSWPWLESDVSASNLSKQLEELTDVNEIHVFINSYGGEVAEGLAIYNALKRHKAKVKTFCDGFACSIASVIFMAGEERIMGDASMLMIHNAWTWATGNAAELRKQADDLEKITQASVNAYKAHATISEEEIKALMDAETWLLPDEALEYGFATSIVKEEQEHASQNAKMKLLDIIKASRPVQDGEPEEKPEDEPEDPEQPEDNPDDEKPDTEDPERPDDDSDGDEQPEDDSEEPEQENAAQKWSGFFNALINH